LAARNDLFITESNRLSEQAVRSLFAHLPLFDRQAVHRPHHGHVHGLFSSGVRLHLVNALGFARTYAAPHRLHGLLCGIPRMRMARDICVANPARTCSSWP